MIDESTTVVVLLELAQAGFGMLVAMLMLRFYASLGSKYYLYWVLAWGSLVIQHLASAFIHGEVGAYFLIVLVVVKLITSYCQFLFFIVGFYELTYRRSVRFKTIRFLFLASVLFPIASLAVYFLKVFDAETSDFIVFGLNAGVSVLFLSFSAVLSMRIGLTGYAMKLVLMCFLGYGMLRLYDFIYWISKMVSYLEIQPVGTVFSVLDFLCIALFGLSNIMAVLEFESVRLKKVNLQLDTFIYRSSFDLKAPLRVMKSLLELIKIGNAKEKKALRLRMSHEIDRADQVIMEIIHLRESQHQQVLVGLVNIRSLISEVLKELVKEDKFRYINIAIDIKPGSVLSSDESRLKNVFYQILINALRFHDLKAQPANILFHCKKVKQGLQVVIEDNGPGVEKSQVAHLAEMFYKVNNVTHGPGLGLYMVKQVLRKIESEIVITSVLGEGTKVKLFLKNLKGG